MLNTIYFFNLQSYFIALLTI